MPSGLAFRIIATLALLAAGCAGDVGQGNDGGMGRDGASADAPESAVDAAPADVALYAPYFYTWSWGSSQYAFASLVDMQEQGGPSAVTIAFVLSGGGCQVSREIIDNLADVDAYRAAGGRVRASFGGAFGTYLENACPDAGSLADAIIAFVDATQITDLDFDIEQGTTSSNAAINAMRGAALAQVQSQRGIRVTFTLPVNPDGLNSLGRAVVQASVDAGVDVAFVNVMTMDYGSGTDLGQVPIQSVDATAQQLQALFPGLTAADAYRRVGATPMIGRNDDGSVFSLDDANALIAHARASRVGLVSFWAIQRDEPCPAALDLDVCNGSSASTFAYHQIFAGVNP